MSTKQLSCTILGANGYIGRHLAYYLHNLGYQIFAYDIPEERNVNIPSDIPYESFDICNNFQHIRTDVDYLFILSGITGTKNGFDSYKTFIEVNEIGLLNILSLIKDMQAKPAVIFPSTRLVYKGAEHSLLEDDEKEAKTIYAANKIAAEQYLKIYHRCFGINYIVYRICVPYGNLFDEHFSYGTIGAFLKRAKSGEPITLYGDGEIKRTLTHISSICQQIADSMILPSAKNNVFNIAGETFSLKEIAYKIADLYHSDVKFIPWNDLDLAIESGSTVFNGEKIQALVEINKKNTLDSWMKQNLLNLSF